MLDNFNSQLYSEAVEFIGEIYRSSRPEMFCEKVVFNCQIHFTGIYF